MKRITLPALEETASVSEGWQALREYRVHGLVARGDAEFWVYDADDVADAVRRNTRLTLQQVRRRRIRVLARDQHPSEQALQQFFDAHENESVVMAAADRVFGTDVLNLFAPPESPLAAEAKAYRCPQDPNEVSTMKLHCKVHDVDYIEDK
jgi:hypothetical protein